MDGLYTNIPGGDAIPRRLQPIIAAARVRATQLSEHTDRRQLETLAAQFEHRSFDAALRAQYPAVIAEVKRGSPSRGLIDPDLDPVKLARSYEEGGAAAISVVTEPEFFSGDGAWIAQIRDAVSLPILRKDFIVEEIQVDETAALGADAILLIARVLSVDKLSELTERARLCGLEILFEAHTEEDIEKIVAFKPEVIGVNARDLDSFAVDRSQYARLRDRIPAAAVAVAESGLSSHAEITGAECAGYHAFLIGESLVRSTDPCAALRELIGTDREETG